MWPMTLETFPGDENNPGEKKKSKSPLTKDQESSFRLSPSFNRVIQFTPWNNMDSRSLNVNPSQKSHILDSIR